MEIVMKGYNLDYFKHKDIYTWDEIIGIIEDIIADKERLEEELEDLKQDVEDNYKPVSYAEQVGYNERDFY